MISMMLKQFAMFEKCHHLILIISICFVLSRKGTADAHLKLLYEKCLNDYIDEMHEALRSVDTYCSDAELQQKHLRATENAMKRVRFYFSFSLLFKCLVSIQI